MINQSEWKWYGFPCHCIVSKRCVYHLATRIGDKLISTIGAFFPERDGKMKPLGSGNTDFYETMVFECSGEDKHGNPNITDWVELLCKRYETSEQAEKGHYVICLDIASKA